MSDCTAREYRHIVDMDGLLLGIDPKNVTPENLLERAGICGERRVFQVKERREIPLSPGQRVELTESQVLYFRSAAAEAHAGHCMRMAA